MGDFEPELAAVGLASDEFDVGPVGPPHEAGLALARALARLELARRELTAGLNAARVLEDELRRLVDRLACQPTGLPYLDRVLHAARAELRACRPGGDFVRILLPDMLAEVAPLHYSDDEGDEHLLLAVAAQEVQA